MTCRTMPSTFAALFIAILCGVGCTNSAPDPGPSGEPPPDAPVTFEVRLAFGDRRAESTEFVDDSTGRTWFIADAMVVDQHDIAAISAATDVNGRPSLLISLGGAGAARLEAATREHIGSPIAIMIDGKVVSTPIVRSALSDRLMVTGPEERLGDVDAIARGLMRQFTPRANP